MGLSEVTRIEIVEDMSHRTPSDVGFIGVKRMLLRNHYADGSRSGDYHCDMVVRRGLDAVGVVPYCRRPDGGVDIFMVRSFRPAVYLRPVNPEATPYLLEIIAGVIEPEDGDTFAGMQRRAAEELHEEAGLRVDPGAIVALGAPLYATPGANTEKLYYLAVEVNPDTQETPTTDGSEYERNSHPVRLDLLGALARIASGEIKDAKTEVALYRLLRLLSSGRAAAEEEHSSKEVGP